MDWTLVIENLKYTLYGSALFAAAYVANMLLGIFKNVFVLREHFDWNKIYRSAIKILAVAGGCTLLSVTSTTLPQFATMVGWDIPQEFAQAFSALAIIGIFLYSTCKYVIEAISKLKNILAYSVTDTEVTTKDN